MGTEPTLQVTLAGGPFDGIVVDRPEGRSLLVFDDSLGDDHAASYRQGRQRERFTFRGISRIIAQMPAPGSDHA